MTSEYNLKMSFQILSKGPGCRGGSESATSAPPSLCPPAAKLHSVLCPAFLSSHDFEAGLLFFIQSAPKVTTLNLSGKLK